MTRLTLLLQPVPVLVSWLLLCCNSSSSLPRPGYPVPDQRLSQQEPAEESATMMLDISGPAADSSGSAEEQPFEETSILEQTIIPVQEDSFGNSSRALRFIAETRGSETIGVRVFFATAEADQASHLGLRLADRIEEVDGLPVTSVAALSRAWQDVGRRPEVHFLIRRGDQAHTIVYRQRSFGMP
jgi:hypothetical protein